MRPKIGGPPTEGNYSFAIFAAISIKLSVWQLLSNGIKKQSLFFGLSIEYSLRAYILTSSDSSINPYWIVELIMELYSFPSKY